MGRAATSAEPTSTTGGDAQQGQGGIASQRIDTAIDPGRRTTGEETGINRDTAQRTVSDVTRPKQQAVPSVPTSKALSNLQWPPGGSDARRTGQHEAGRP